MQTNKRTLYQGSYRQTLEDPDTPVEETVTPDEEEQRNATSDTDPATPEERSWKKRYGDLRSHTNSLTERVKSLEGQLQAAQKQEVKIPSTKEELGDFAQKYPDVFRHILSIARTELFRERETLQTETKVVKDNLEKMERELGYKKILEKHPDFEAINATEEFQMWADAQPKQIQDWLFSSTDPYLCIKGLDLYKAEMGFKKQAAKPRTNGADTLVNTKSKADIPDEQGGKRIWKASEIGKMHPKQYEKYEAEIEQARLEGRLDMSA